MMRQVFRRRGMNLLLAFGIGLSGANALAKVKANRVAVPVGESVSLRGQVRGDTGAAYSVHAEAGQHLHISLQALKGVASFNVYAPGSAPGQEALFRGEVDGDVADLKITQTGEYHIDVFQMRSSARRGAVKSFGLSITLSK